MSQYAKYLICYDVENNRKRKKLFDSLKDIGLVPIQKSVFYGDLKPPEFRDMKRSVTALLDEGDRCLWIQCTLPAYLVRTCPGYENFSYIEPDQHDFI